MDKLLPRHLSDLSKSTLTDETITKYGIKSLTAAEVCQQLNRNDIDCGGYLIPYPHGSSYFKIKLDKPLADCKYLSPKGMSSDIFITYLAQEKQNDITFPLYFAEGEKKSMAMERLGFAAISVPGVY